ncbi:hypothetical protein [Halobacterium wangiae]|uniref:hypothetical protein n=1 Tax=Halobacterium wangiae TaxID=2902623 RepID=UPI001E302DC3|nr:hypothetical protein [Halobacterium wangiae]
MNDQMGNARRVSTMRLYGASVALVSGGYSLYQATTGMATSGTGMMGTGMTGSAWFMAALGVVVLVHGAVLLTPAASSLGRASGPLMVVYAVLMLVNQAWLATAWGGGMTGGGTMNDGSMRSGMDAAMGADAGMVAIAVLMLASGVIMTQRKEMM